MKAEDLSNEIKTSVGDVRAMLELDARMKDHFGERIHNMERWLLNEGELFGPIVKLDDGEELREPKQCYSNAGRAVLNYEVDIDEWFYTEGVMACGSLPILIHHAWLSNEAGEVMELTSRYAHNDGAQYWGIPFKTEWLRKQMLKQGFWGLFSDGIQYQPITERPVPDAIRAWPRKEAAA